MPLRNLPTRAPAPLASLIDLRPGQVSSRALSRDAGLDLTILAFSAGESVSEEEYFGDTLYYLVEGRASVVLPDADVALEAGEVLCVPAHVPHAVDNVGEDFKLLQLTLREG